MKRRLLPFVENFAEASAACLITMVQGNIIALGVAHWVIASRTGVFAGAAATVALALLRNANRWVIAATLAVATAIVDYIVHPGGFGPVIAEALVTGVAAGVLSLGVAWVRTKWKARAAA